VALTAQPLPKTHWRAEGPVFVLARSVRSVVNACVAALLLALPLASAANTLTGLVVGIADGDTLTLLDADHVQHKIRLAGIDAPEKRQAFGNRSKQNLADLVFRKQVSVEWNKFDRYGRVIGKVLAGGEDVCLMQVRAGLAWHYKAYEREQSAADRDRYAQAELEARASRRGLWHDAKPTPPWDSRHQGRR
jgi:endonuclease YncB( thermonuclease family)